MAKWHYNDRGQPIGCWHTPGYDSEGNEVIHVRISSALREELRESSERIRTNTIPKADNSDYESQIRDARYSRPLILRTQTPPWADHDQIKKIYKVARKKTRRYPKGHSKRIVYTVDHIIPLRGNLVSGLHCEDNLRVVPREKNQKKSNRFYS